MYGFRDYQQRKGCTFRIGVNGITHHASIVKPYDILTVQ
jgi:hypothetical protein